MVVAVVTEDVINSLSKRFLASDELGVGRYKEQVHET